MSKRNTLVGPQLQRGRTGFNPDWKRLIAFLVVIVLGSIVETQVLANSYGFHPALGFNLFHVYPLGSILCGRANGTSKPRLVKNARDFFSLRFSTESKPHKISPG